MNFFPDHDQFAELATQGNVVPVYAELTADGVSPVGVYAQMRAAGPAFLLESVAGGEHIGRYSFIGLEPRQTVTAWPQRLRLRHRDGRCEEQACPADPLSALEAIMAAYRPVELPGMPPFSGGAVGYLGHEYVHCVEPTVPLAQEDVLGVPLMHFGVTDQVIAFDHARQVLRIICNAHVDEAETVQAAYAEACATVQTLVERLREGPSLRAEPLQPTGAVEVPTGNFTREQFEQIVARSKEYIRAGDVIQVVASQRFEKAYTAGPLNLYRALRVVNPSPYMFVLETEGFAVVGASPEVHVRSTHGRVEIRPIAGTRPRGADAVEDERLEQDLLADPKERAEHLMLVDLARNDIGRVCETGTVDVKDYAVIERYSHVMHIVSQVEGQLRDDATAYDLMRATFPAGTLTGAPKVRAMQIIAELEGQQRGVYGGALGYFGYNGNLDSCIAIRTALLQQDTIFVQAGAGLVADSVPASEYLETVNKASGLLKAIQLAESLPCA